MLDQHQIEFYREQGYLLVEDVIDARAPGTPAQRRRGDDRKIAGGERKRRGVRSRRGPLGRAAEADAHQGCRTSTCPASTRCCTRRRSRPCCRLCWGRRSRLQTTKLNTKAPGGGAAVEWHQDWAFYPHTNDDLLAIGLILEDVDEANGPLMVIPGSHRGPTLDHTRNGVFAGAVDPDDPLFDRDQAVTLTGKAGSMTVHHVRLLHGSAPNMSDRARLICFYELAAGDAWPLAGSSTAVAGMTQRAGLGLDRQEHLLWPTERLAPPWPRCRPACRCRRHPTAARSSRSRRVPAPSAPSAGRRTGKMPPER